jgi:hypothetical protein
MNLQQKCVDGEIQIRDLDTDNGDIVCVVPLTYCEPYDNDVLGWYSSLVCRIPAMLAALQQTHENCEYILDSSRRRDPTPLLTIEILIQIRNAVGKFADLFVKQPETGGQGDTEA